MKLRITALILCVVFVFAAVPVSAALPSEEPVEPAASYFIADYLGYCKNPSSGTIRVVCDITAHHTIDKLGVSQIEIQYYSSATNSWVYNATIFGNSYNNLLRTDTISVLQGVNLSGLTPNRTYRAVIKFYAKDGSIEETRYYTTSSIYLT